MNGAKVVLLVDDVTDIAERLKDEIVNGQSGRKTFEDLCSPHRYVARLVREVRDADVDAHGDDC